MMIEWLKFHVPESLREAFIRKDDEVWTQEMQKFSGFLGKEVWIDPITSDVVLVIRWASRQAWEAVPKAKVDYLEKQMGELTMPLLESQQYQVRKFFH
ncbi:TIGR03792 family protein [Tumidithrix helvetica PCC 7403]|uniref:TIGR03792 family protein n=1 Tax=Tumidithrix helvetica TaxID=3457545 RepID=UPI003C8CFA58